MENKFIFFDIFLKFQIFWPVRFFFLINFLMIMDLFNVFKYFLTKFFFDDLKKKDILKIILFIFLYFLF